MSQICHPLQFCYCCFRSFHIKCQSVVIDWSSFPLEVIHFGFFILYFLQQPYLMPFWESPRNLDCSCVLRQSFTNILVLAQKQPPEIFPRWLLILSHAINIWWFPKFSRGFSHSESMKWLSQGLVTAQAVRALSYTMLIFLALAICLLCTLPTLECRPQELTWSWIGSSRWKRFLDPCSRQRQIYMLSFCNTFQTCSLFYSS